ncbi:MAG: hypothetical protein R3F29_07280 [Planctomycetota bacterium]
MRIGLLHLSLAIAIACSVPFAPLTWAWLPIWSSAALATVAFASLRADPRWFGKRRDGSVPALATVALAPFLLPLWAYWHVRRPLWSEQAAHRLLPELVIGRRLLGHELGQVEQLLDVKFEHLVDLTCEYAEAAAVRRRPGYLSLPIVDGCAPRVEELVELVQRLHQLDGPMFLHCAMGHGRASMVAAALLLARGVTTDLDEALLRIRTVRPKARPYAEQKTRLAEFWEHWHRLTASPDAAR